MPPHAPAGPPRPTVSVIVPVHRDGADVRRCLAALHRLDPAPLEILVAVDGADPGTIDLARTVASEVVPLARRGGPARARNAAAAVAQGDVLLFVDSDCEAPPSLVGQVADHLARRADVAGLMGSYDSSPGAPNFLSQYKNLMHHYVHHRSRTTGFTFWGACGALRATAFATVGGFDESYTAPSVEDIDLGYRLRAAGARIDVVPSIQVKHLKRWDPVPLLRAEIFGRALPWSRIILRHGRFDDDLNIDRAGRTKVVLTGLLAVGTATAAVGPRRPDAARTGAVVAAASVLALLGLDRGLLGFYGRLRGPVFAARAVPWLWLSYLYSGAAFAWAWGEHRIAPLTGRRRPVR